MKLYSGSAHALRRGVCVCVGGGGGGGLVKSSRTTIFCFKSHEANSVFDLGHVTFG